MVGQLFIIKLKMNIIMDVVQKIKIPDEIIEKTDKSQRLSEVVAKFVGRTDDEISTIGTNGLLTQGAYTRTDEFTDSIVCAIATKYKKINNKEN